MKILFLGLGSIGCRHLRILKELVQAEIVWCSNGNNPNEKMLIKKYGIQIKRSIEAALAEKIDFAVISNPTSRHVESATRIAEAKVPFFLEKPVSGSMGGVEELRRIVLENNVKVLVGYNFRYHPAFKVLKTAVNKGLIGAPLSLRAELGQYLPDWHPDRDYRKDLSAKRDMGGGVVLDLSHEIDLAVNLFGEVDKVSAICSKYSSLEIETEDIAEITMVHKSNRLSQIHLDYCQRVYSKSLVVIGDKGTIVWNYTEKKVDLLSPCGNETLWRGSLKETRDEMFKDQMTHWLSVLNGEDEAEVSLEDGIYVTRIALAAKRSSEEGKHICVGQFTR